MKFTVRIFTVIPAEAAQCYTSVVEAESMDTAQIQLSRKIAHEWVEIPHARSVFNVRTSYIAATEITPVEEPVVPSIETPPAPSASEEPVLGTQEEPVRELPEAPAGFDSPKAEAE